MPGCGFHPSPYGSTEILFPYTGHTLLRYSEPHPQAEKRNEPVTDSARTETQARFNDHCLVFRAQRLQAWVHTGGNRVLDTGKPAYLASRTTRKYRGKTTQKNESVVSASPVGVYLLLAPP